MVPIKPVNLHFLILKYLRIGFSKKTISHSASQKYATSFFHPQKLKNPDFFLRWNHIAPSWNYIVLTWYRSNLELYGSICSNWFQLGTLWFLLFKVSNNPNLVPMNPNHIFFLAKQRLKIMDTFKGLSFIESPKSISLLLKS